MRTRDENKICLLHQKAIEMIVQEGLDGFGVNKLAKAAGVSPATIYIYFKDREDLIVQVSLHVSDRMLKESLEGFDPEMSFEEGLRKQWQNRARYFLKNPMDVEFVEKMRYSHLYDKMAVHLYTTFKEVMSKFYQNAVARKQLIPLPFEVYWAVAFAPLYQLIKFHTQEKSFGHKKYTFTEDTMEQTLQLVLKALRP
ncbi:TetR/AcrR family transcriptional regulator [Chitinophaga sp. GCM10012297]|uniref:Helix-turn-helix transcriptional regulator n=1 Tax=Chitinophaga chungangae TaxID=2821488 RepID=A0ABS3Y857_9BACT|nr:TetR/AcrR family transcriptional regulator [Chitinophaga chungangae]MBO9150845.1 helix-turn-helix transcriptional regulator [Chitinophaga chungangae]